MARAISNGKELVVTLLKSVGAGECPNLAFALFHLFWLGSGLCSGTAYISERTREKLELFYQQLYISDVMTTLLCFAGAKSGKVLFSIIQDLPVANLRTEDLDASKRQFDQMVEITMGLCASGPYSAHVPTLMNMIVKKISKSKTASQPR